MKTRKEILEFVKECENKVKELYKRRHSKNVTYSDLKRIDTQIIQLENRIVAYKHVLI